MIFLRTVQHPRVLLRCYLLLMLSCLLAPVVAQAQGSLPASQAGFFTYACDFNTELDRAEIRGVLLDTSGLPVPENRYAVQVTLGGASLIAQPAVTVSTVAEREPIRIIMVIDATVTVPMPNIVNALRASFVNQLLPEDAVALLTFSNTISPLTQYYTDKTQLVDEHLSALTTRDGDNRMYDAILAAVASMTPNSPVRQAVLILADSARNNLRQATVEEIISRASLSKTQIFSISFHTADIPDEADMVEMANGTGAHAWLYDAPERSRTQAEAIVSRNLERLITALNSEILISIDGEALRSAGSEATLDVALTLDGNITLSDRVRCPVLAAAVAEVTEAAPEPTATPEQIVFDIRFAENYANRVVRDSLDINVDAEVSSDLVTTSIVFFIDDSIVQNSPAGSYRFEGLARPAGLYRLYSQLRDLNGDVLATTPIINLYVQQDIAVALRGGIPAAGVGGSIEIEAATDPSLPLAEMQFTLASADNPGSSVLLTGGELLTEADGTVRYRIASINQTIRALLPGEPNGIIIQAEIPGADAASPDLARSVQALQLAIAPPAEAPGLTQMLIPVAIAIVMLLVNLFIARLVNEARVNRMIAQPDRHELPSQLMSLSLSKGLTKQPFILTKKTMFIGRGSSNDISPGDDVNLSRQHGVVMWRKRNWYYVNRKRGVKTQIDDKNWPSMRLYKLKPGTEIQVGNYQLIFHANAEKASPTDMAPTNIF